MGQGEMTEIHAEMTASVWQVSVGVGDAVNVGDTLFILESMKMEIPVTSPVAGTVVRVSVIDGENVLRGDLLAVLE
jgi:acetyl-CoA carboxylase biotin carboxyl carrier protein